MEQIMPGGRPTVYKPEHCQTVIECGKQGKTLASMAAALKVHRETVNEWRDKYPEFSDAVKLGLLFAQAWWEEKGQHATFGGCDGFNATSFIFNMKNRFKDEWSDTGKVDVTSNGQTIGVIERVIVDTIDNAPD